MRLLAVIIICMISCKPHIVSIPLEELSVQDNLLIVKANQIKAECLAAWCLGKNQIAQSLAKGKFNQSIIGK